MSGFIRAGQERSPHDTVFCSQRGTLYLHSQLGEAFACICARLKSEHVTPHAMCLIISSLMEEHRHAVRAASTLVGLASEQMTLTDYTRSHQA